LIKVFASFYKPNLASPPFNQAEMTFRNHKIPQRDNTFSMKAINYESQKILPHWNAVPKEIYETKISPNANWK